MCRILTISIGLDPDPWQLSVLRGQHPRLLLNCCRQAGKSTVVAVHALLQAIYTENLLVLLLSRSHRQSAELFRIVTRFFERIKSPLQKRRTVEELLLRNTNALSNPSKAWSIPTWANAWFPRSPRRSLWPCRAPCELPAPVGVPPSRGTAARLKAELQQAELQQAAPLRLVGGIDFGYRNPFAALWGAVDRDGVLWITGEHYCRERPLSYHAERLPRPVHWYADPAGANERAELHCAGFTVHKGDNALRPGIAAVNARIQTARLKILAGACPNLLAESALYRYGDDPSQKHAEVPVDEHNHALAALRYLVSRIDRKKMAGNRPTDQNLSQHQAALARSRRWLRLDNEQLWSQL